MAINNGSAHKGAWTTHRMSKPQGGGLDWYVTRDVHHAGPYPWTDIECLNDADGARLKFASLEDAEAAIKGLQ